MSATDTGQVKDCIQKGAGFRLGGKASVEWPPNPFDCIFRLKARRAVVKRLRLGQGRCATGQKGCGDDRHDMVPRSSYLDKVDNRCHRRMSEMDHLAQHPLKSAQARQRPSWPKPQSKAHRPPPKAWFGHLDANMAAKAQMPKPTQTGGLSHVWPFLYHRVLRGQPPAHTPFLPAKERFWMFARADDFFDTKVWVLCHKGGRPRPVAALRIPAETQEFIA